MTAIQVIVACRRFMWAGGGRVLGETARLRTEDGGGDCDCEARSFELKTAAGEDEVRLAIDTLLLG